MTDGPTPPRELSWVAERVARGLFEAMVGEARGVWVVHGPWVLARVGDTPAPPAVLQEGRRVVYRDTWMFVGEQVPGQPYLVVVVLWALGGGLSLTGIGKLRAATEIFAAMLSTA